MITYNSQSKLFAGVNCTKEALGKIFEETNAEKILLLHDANVDVSSLFFIEFSGIMPLDCNQEPSYQQLDQILKNLRIMNERKKYDLIIGIGGGSALDITKAVAVLIDNARLPIECRGFDKIEYPGIPTVVIPTTLSGSEATNNAVFIDLNENKKLGINGRYMFSAYSILDPVWLPSQDSKYFVSSFLDAFTHAYESKVCVQANVLTKGMSDQALHILKWFISEDPEGDAEALLQVQLAANMAARSLCNSGSGISGALSYILGTEWKVPHGIAGAIFLPDVIRYNQNEELAELLESYIVQNEISLWLNDYGVNDLLEFHNKVVGLQKAFDQNPIPFDAREDGFDLLKKHWKGSEVIAKPKVKKISKKER